MANIHCMAALVVAGFTTSAQAQVTAPEALPKVQVTGKKIDGAGRTEGSDSYTTVSTNTAFKLPLTLRETPQTVTVIPQKVIKDFNLQDTRDILEFTPGVHVQSERNTEAYYFQSRGFGMQTQFDGVPSPNGFGARGVASPDSAFLDRVEVLHGANGLLSGPGAPGGTVNLVHKTPTDIFAAQLEADMDSFGGYRLVGDVSGPLTAALGSRLVVIHEERDLFVEHASGKHNAAYGALEFPLGDRTRFLFGGTWEEINDASYGAHYGIPTQPDGTLYDMPRKLNLGATWATQDDRQYGVFLRGQHDFGSGWSMLGLVSHDRTDFEALESVPGSEVTPVIQLWAQIEGWDNESTSLDLYVEGPVELFGRSHDLMFGVNGAKRSEPQDLYRFTTEAIAVIDPATWDPRNAPDPFSVPWDAVHWGNGEREQYGAFAVGRLEIVDTLHAIVGSRVSWTTASWEGMDYADESEAITPYAGVVWDFSRSMSAYASYSEIFEPQDLSVVDASGAVLEPIVGENLEAGLKLELFDGAFNGSLAIFQLDQTNLAEPDFVGELPGVCGPTAPFDYCSKATGLVRSEGFDFALSGEVAPGWQVIGGYSYIDQKYEAGESAGLRFDTLTPRHTLHLAGMYSAPDGKWSVGASARYQSEVFTAGELEWALDGDDLADDIIPYRIEQSAYTVLGLYGRYQVTEKVGLNLTLENALDESYLSGISWPVHGQVYGDPRRASLTVTTTF